MWGLLLDVSADMLTFVDNVILPLAGRLSVHFKLVETEVNRIAQALGV